MDTTPFRVEEDQGNRQDSLFSVEGGQASHAPPMNESEPAARGAIDILQKLAQALQRAAQPRLPLNDQPLRGWQGTDR